MDDWESPSSLGNEKLLSWLASGAEGPAPNGMEFHGYELHAHPDLLEPLDQLGEFPVKHVAAFGIPALAHPNGVIFVFAFGSRYLYFRNVELPLSGDGRGARARVAGFGSMVPSGMDDAEPPAAPCP